MLSKPSTSRRSRYAPKKFHRSKIKIASFHMPPRLRVKLSGHSRTSCHKCSYILYSNLIALASQYSYLLNIDNHPNQVLPDLTCTSVAPVSSSTTATSWSSFALFASGRNHELFESESPPPKASISDALGASIYSSKFKRLMLSFLTPPLFFK